MVGCEELWDFSGQVVLRYISMMPTKFAKD